MGRWSVIVPEETTNLVTNPSFEVATTGWSAMTGVIARSALDSVFGLYSLVVTPAGSGYDGVYFGPVALTVGVSYTFSIYVRGVDSVPYRIYFATTAGNVVGTPTTFVGDGQWHRYSVTWLCNSSGNYRLYVAKNGCSSTDDFYVDAAQLEAKAYATTYCDGSLDPPRGFALSGCSWSGVHHASTSQRVATTRAGGREVDLEDLGLWVLDDLNTGAPPVSVLTRPYVALPGDYYDNTRIHARQITLVGVIRGLSLSDLQQRRNDVIAAVFTDDLTHEPVLLRYTGAARKLEIAVHYDGGLGGGETVNFVEKLVLQFIAPYPYWREVIE